MAYGKKFFTSYKSFNGWDYYMEFFIRDYVGAATEVSLGKEGVVISYDTDSEDRDNNILSSQLEIPLVIQGPTEDNFIDDLRDIYSEQDVYVHLYQSTSANKTPLWSGFILMDLGDKEDVFYPFEVKLTATDGLSLLKDRDFVWDSAVKPYSNADMIIGPYRFTSIISLVLQKLGVANLDTGAFVTATFVTAGNWYNEKHQTPSMNVDPIRETMGKTSWSYSADDNGDYNVSSCYDVLNEVLKVWHCRIVYWENTFYIVQIPEYNTAESGTNLNPVNVNSRRYFINGAAYQNKPYLGNTDLTRYQLNVGLTSPARGAQKLTGTKYQYYPRLKSVVAEYVSGGGTNYYNGFPTWNGSVLDSPIQQISLIDANAADNLFLSIPLNISKTYGDDVTARFRFDLKATDGTTIKWLENNSGTYTWVNSQPSNYPNDKRMWAEANLSGVNPAQYIIFDDTIPTDSSFTGSWMFELILDDSDWGGSTGTSFIAISYNIGYGGVSLSPIPFGIEWTNIPNTSSLIGAFEGQLLTLNALNSVNISGQNILVETSESDSDKFDFGKIMWGDSQDETDPGNLSVWDGSSWEQTSFIGKWGVGINTGSEPFTKLMITEYLRGQSSNIQIINAKIMISENGKSTDDGTYDAPNYINPIGRIREFVPGTDSFYVFKRGKFFTSSDEWDYEGWVIKDENTTTTTTTTNTWSPNGPASDDSGVMGL